MTKSTIATFIIIAMVSLSIGGFVRDWWYWKYDRVCVDPVTDIELERVYDK